MKLYDYIRSTAAYRVRIALALKAVPYETISIHLLNQGGEHHHPDYLQINPQGLIPSLEDSGQILTQSLAIIEYLEETVPQPSLLPQTPLARAQVRSLADLIACDMHPINNLRVLNQLRAQFNADEKQVKTWYHHWLEQGFDAYEKRIAVLEREAGFSYGDAPSLADLCLIPQVFNAQRFDFSMEAYPLINAIVERCLQIKAFDFPS